MSTTTNQNQLTEIEEVDISKLKVVLKDGSVRPVKLNLNSDKVTIDGESLKTFITYWEEE